MVSAIDRNEIKRRLFVNYGAQGITDTKVQRLEAQVRRLVAQERQSDKALDDLRLLIKVNPAVIYRLDSEGHITFMSAEIKNLLGLTPQELLGEHISAIVADEDQDKLLPITAVRTGSRMTRGVEVRFRKKISILCTPQSTG